MKLLLLTCVVAVGFAQQPPSRTIQYRGVVVDTATGAPIPGAIVTAKSELTPPAAPTATTDRSGRFKIDVLFPNRLSLTFWPLTFSKPGYFETPGDYSPGERLQDADGSVRFRQAIGRLTAYASISVKVLDPSGNAAPGAMVGLSPLGSQAPHQANPADADGRFQTRVSPGGYLICAEPAKSIAIATCYPSATDFASAKVVIIHPAEAAGPFIVTMRKQPPKYTIRGQIRSLMTKTAAWGEAVTATPIPSDEPGPDRAGGGYGCVKPDGSFSIAGLRAGRYLLRASAGPEVRRDDCSPQKAPEVVFESGMDDTPRFRPRAPVFGLFQTVTVSRDIKGLVLKIGKDAIVTGRVVVESDGAKASPMRSLTLRSHDLPDMNFGIQQSIELGADGRFQNREVEPGVYAIAQSEGPWYVSSIVQDGKTSADGHIELKAEGKTNLDVTYRKASSMLQVDVLRDAGMTADQPVQLRLFPADPALRFQAGGFRLAAFVKSEQSTFTLGPVPPGSYLLLATYSDPNVQRLEAFRWNLMKNRAIPVVLHEGATETIQVKPLALETGQ